ncbi:MBL fold metallo-hydrolase [Alteromonas flava]|uniref:MBL fold metallo-hydrolase n=1 Tax=Alteromonas flava TaxID=2048003 RepID=UPI000C28F916|nr:MBL fold metallo-hydrolase [Alteromonas flava]
MFRVFSRRLLFLAVLVTVLSGCAHFTDRNNVTVIASNSGLVSKANDGRYENLYPDKQDYPVTCEQDCYPKTAQLACENDTSKCLYNGQRNVPELNTGFAITWIGHASFLISLPDNTRLLFDPVSTQFDWPIDWLHALSGGITRNEPEWPEAQVSGVDAVLYSHLHYDHFNKSDIAQLGNAPTYFVHQDTADYLPQLGLNVKEMSWFSNYQLGEVRISAVPAHHFNSRYWVPLLYDDNEMALWGGWLLEYQDKTLFFAGDTGYSAHFKDIKKHYGNIDICLLPIASYYHPEHGKWYRYVHTTPEDALIAADDLGCKVMIPWGYGNASWQMGDHSSHSPLKRLLKMHQTVSSQLPVLILNEGESVSL